MNVIMMRLAILLLVLQILALAQAEEPPRTLLGLPLLAAENFEAGKADRFEPTDPMAWKVGQQDGNHIFSQFKASDYKPAVRSPFNYALLKDAVVGDGVLEARVQSTAKEYNHRDLCFFFGHQDATHFYYVHISKAADQNAHNVFIVNNAPRTPITKTRTTGVQWGDGWHTVRIVRRVEAGTIEVYFDDLEKPIMTAEDKTFAWGRVGLGSFDDTGNFDDVRLWGAKVEPKK